MQIPDPPPQAPTAPATLPRAGTRLRLSAISPRRPADSGVYDPIQQKGKLRLRGQDTLHHPAVQWQSAPALLSITPRRAPSCPTHHFSQRPSPSGCKLCPLVSFRPSYMDFPGGPAVETLRFHCRGPRFEPWSGTKIPQATRHNQKRKNLPRDPCPPKCLSRSTPHSTGCPSLLDPPPWPTSDPQPSR